mmetsp:Transcript_24413/g.69646  ORF Transcript_24413/g.69646 Transcript_24413/m.69646 type:complete len:250 (-) Transcript_24413:94-843(-)
MPSMEVEERLRAVRWIFQGLGAASCIMFALQGVVIFIDYSSDYDFWETCHWLSQGVLCVVVGLGGVAFEARSLVMPGVMSSLIRNAKYRIGLGLIYLWIGCYSSGGRIVEAGDGWSVAGQVTGIIAWVVAAANLVLSVFVEHSEAPASNGATPAKSAGTSDATPQQWSTGPTGGSGANQQWATSGDPSPSNPWAAGSGVSDQPPSTSSIGRATAPSAAGASPPEPALPETAIAPPGGWNAFASKPFGSA